MFFLEFAWPVTHSKQQQSGVSGGLRIAGFGNHNQLVVQYSADRCFTHVRCLPSCGYMGVSVYRCFFYIITDKSEKWERSLK